MQRPSHAHEIRKIAHGLSLHIDNAPPYVAGHRDIGDKFDSCGLPPSSVAHYRDQDGDPMRDLRAKTGPDVKAKRNPAPDRPATGEVFEIPAQTAVKFRLAG